MLEESFKIDQAKFNAITNEQIKHLFAWQERTVEPAFSNLDKDIKEIKIDLDNKIQGVSTKANTLIILNIILLILVIGKSFPEILKVLVKAL